MHFVNGNTGRYQERQELSYQKFASFTITALDAKEYAYSKEKKRRVRKFTDFVVNLYI